MDITDSAIITALKGAMSNWAVSFPMVIVWIVGIFVAIARWRRSPKVSLLVIISCGLSLLTTLVMPVVQQLALTLNGPYNGAWFSTILMAVSLVWTCFAAVSGGLLIYAAFADRPEATDR
jgi:hypothetical protein